MKRIISTILILTFVLSMSVTTAFADPNGNKLTGWAKKGFKLPPGISKKVFNDLNDFPWAKDAIEKMNLKGLIKGYGDGVFAPKNAVTKLETVIMTLRVLGWEEESKGVSQLPKKYKGNDVAEWAKGYISVAHEKGILDDVDMMYFNPQEPAKRHEVAKYVIRALGYEEEAQDHQHSKLSFVDAPAIPVGSIGYVYLVNEMKIMQGDNVKRFNPMGTLTRAEMAVLFERLDKKVDNGLDENEYSGEVYRIEDERIGLKIDGQVKYFSVDDDDIIVYEGNSRIDYEDIKIGSTVLIQLEDGEVVYIEIIDEKDEKIISRYSGTVASIHNTSPKSITLQNQKMKLIFETTKNTKVYFKNVQGRFDEIKTHDDATIVVDNNNRARTIYIDRYREKQDIKYIQGIVTDIDLDRTDYSIEIDNVEYDLSKDVEVQLEDDESNLDDIIEGYTVEVKITNNVVTEIVIMNQLGEIEGIVQEITENSIKIKVGNKIKEYRYNVLFTLKVNANEKEFSDLEKGMKVELKLRNNLVYRIDAEDYEYEIEGSIYSIQSNRNRLIIQEDGRNSTYNISEKVEIEIDDEDDKDVSDLRRGQEGTFTIVNNTIVEIEIE